MTNSETTELHNNQDKALYEKLATDEQDKAHDKKHPFKLDVEIKLNDGVKESNTDEADSEKHDNPIANGHHGSKASLGANEKDISQLEVAGKKLEDDEDDNESDSDQDTFMFGMSKLRTFFFFLSLALLVAFVLVFVFVLPCSEGAQMDERTNTLTQSASGGSVSQLGDMDGDAKDDVAFFTPYDQNKPADTSSNRKRRQVEGEDSSKCVVDESYVECVGEISVVTSQTGSPIGVRPVGLEPHGSIKCVSGGERKKMWCAFESADKKHYMLDMKTTSSKSKSNMTSVVAEGCEEFDLIPLSAEESSATYGFLQTCPTSTEGHFIAAPTLTKQKVQLAEISGHTVLDQHTILHQTRVVTLSANGTSAFAITSHLPTVNEEGKVEMKLGKKFNYEVNPEGEWTLSPSAVGFVMFSTHQVLVPRGRDQKELWKMDIPQHTVKSVAKDRESKYSLVELCDDNQPPSTCHYALYNLDQEESDKTAHAETGDIIQFHLDSQMPVEYVVGSRFNYFVAWHFEGLKEESHEETVEKKPEASAGEVEESKEADASANDVTEKKRRHTEGEENHCEGQQVVASMLGFTHSSMNRPALLYKTVLCDSNQLRFVGLSGQLGTEPAYTLAVEGTESTSVYGIALPPLSMVNKQGATLNGWM